MTKTEDPAGVPQENKNNTASTPDTGGGNPWKSRLPLLIASHAAGTTNSVAILSMAPVISAAFSLSAVQFGLFVSFYYSGQAVWSVPAGGVTDKLGVGWALVIGHAIMAAAALLISFAPDFTTCQIAAFFMGVGYSMLNPSTARGVFEWFPAHRRGTAMGLKQVGVPIGGLMGAACGFLAATVNWQSLMLAVGGIIAVNGLLCLTLVPISTRGGGARKNIAAVVTDGRVTAFAVGGGVINMGQTNFFGFLTLFLADAARMGQQTVSTAMAVAQAASAVGRVGWGVISDKAFGGRRIITMTFMCVAAAVFLALMALLTDAWGFVLGFGLALCLGLTIASFAPVAQAIQVEMVSPHLAGSAVGYNMLWTHACAAAAPLMFGYAVDHWGGFDAGWLVTAGAVALGTAGMFILVRTGPGRTQNR
ncbi:MAG: MFS transporter [Rhodospirillaceae bacterium]